MVTFLYAFLLPVLGLQHMASCSMFPGGLGVGLGARGLCLLVVELYYIFYVLTDCTRSCGSRWFFSTWRCMQIPWRLFFQRHQKQGGGFKKKYVHPNLGKWSNLTSIFFRWVETTNQKKKATQKITSSKGITKVRWSDTHLDPGPRNVTSNPPDFRTDEMAPQQYPPQNLQVSNLKKGVTCLLHFLGIKLPSYHRYRENKPL